jgi:hypothetical protein
MANLPQAMHLDVGIGVLGKGQNFAEGRIGRGLATAHPTYSSFQMSVWQSRNPKRSPWLCLALTLPSPSGRGGIDGAGGMLVDQSLQ